MSRREFHFSEGTSSKFWIITVDGAKYTVQFGRIGTAGQTQAKEFPDAEAARNAADRLIAEKTKKGYTEAGGDAVASAPPPAKGKAKPAAVAPPGQAVQTAVTR